MKKNLNEEICSNWSCINNGNGRRNSSICQRNNDHEDNDRGKRTESKGYNVNRQHSININFNDMKSAQWAMRYIASLASKRVFEGYEDGISNQTRPYLVLKRSQLL